ncbi:MAG TPA: M28 family metallopeptidase [Gammaproteobacteria bacterium]|nr:M28 family metallopeptidase [Gammaproteobacteria bacterium]
MRRTAVLLAVSSAALLAACLPSPPEPAAPLTAAALAAHVRVLASDAFGGREPATPGEEKTIGYLREQFEQAGLEPGNGTSFFQPVPLVAITAAPDMTLRVTGKERFALEYGRDFVAWTKRVVTESAVTDSELVFAGYGIVAPELGWNDYAGSDVRGKTVVLLVNDPDHESPDGGPFQGRRMTYYGRWTYKFEEAARQGAAGVLLVHEDGAAGYPWGVVTGSWTGPQFDLVAADRNLGRAAVEGWLTQQAAQRLFEAAGHDYTALRNAARERGFRAVPLGLTASLAIRNTIRESLSHNVVGVLRGRERPDEYVVYVAHWDHLGEDPALEGDRIFNGAVDNATGVAGLIELARAFARLTPRPARSIVFLAVTAEESGLLGSRHYTENPLFPLERTVAAINMDSLNVFGRTRDVTVYGRGASELEDYLAGAAAAQGRVLTDEDAPEKGYYYRSDHFNFAKHGVPALYAESGVDLREGGVARGRALAERFTAEHYHKPSDEYREDWDLAGMVEDLQLLFAVGRRLATGNEWPNWREGNEFRAIRDASRHAAAEN